MYDINYETFKEKLGDKGFNQNDIDKIIDVLKDLRYRKNRKVSQTLKERANNGLVCGRPTLSKKCRFVCYKMDK